MFGAIVNVTKKQGWLFCFFRKNVTNSLKATCGNGSGKVIRKAFCKEIIYCVFVESFFKVKKSEMSRWTWLSSCFTRPTLNMRKWWRLDNFLKLLSKLLKLMISLKSIWFFWGKWMDVNDRDVSWVVGRDVKFMVSNK